MDQKNIMRVLSKSVLGSFPKLMVPFVCLVTLNANAAHNCIGKVNTVDVQGNGKINVNIEGIGDGNIVCSLTANHGEFTPEACKAALTLLTAAKFSGSKVRVYFRNDANPSCAKGSWIDFASHGVYYLRAEG